MNIYIMERFTMIKKTWKYTSKIILICLEIYFWTYSIYRTGFPKNYPSLKMFDMIAIVIILLIGIFTWINFEKHKLLDKISKYGFNIGFTAFFIVVVLRLTNII